MSYVDGFLLPVPTKNLKAYRALAKKASTIWKEHGALHYVECVGDDLDSPPMVSFRKSAGTKKNETVVFSFVIYKSRAHRDAANKKIMRDPRLAKMMTGKPPFDCKRMAYGGFKVLVEA